MSGRMAERLRAIREYVGMDLEDAAAAARIGASDLSELETGAQPPNDLVLERLARAYGYKRGYFLQCPAPLNKANVVARFGEQLTDRDQHEATMFAAYLQDASSD